MKNYSNVCSFKRKYVYFEKQSKDLLCGLHSLNVLLQGPFFNPISLSEIGIKLNEMELNLLDSNRKLYHKNSNVDDNGNFNIQVLTEALKFHGCEIRHLKHKEVMSISQSNNYSNIDAFIFNSFTHWFTFRKIEGIWFNLNSTNSYPGPEIVSEPQLSSLLQTNQNLGYTNFIITNLPKLPDINSSLYQHLQPHQYLVPFENINRGKQFLPKTSTSYGNSYMKINNNDLVENEETRQACQLSIVEYIEQIKREIPPEPRGNGFIVSIKFNNEVFTRKWNGNDKIKHLKKYVQSKISTLNKIELLESFPRYVYSNDEATLMQCKFALNQVLVAKLL